ncbi:threonine ammonia-lyase [Candidatus Marsarchaeota G2 archaeon OSP_D]|jgi:threonine dehydratase, medium form|uniref:threonine ammonia-lyase n=5 Tax=Candidatus Marsarchaeota group 2 TaxID=2203771 RepID=A0A2R6C9X9_9ARCH|nr:MAG: threonine ammonia-lyase [Candidatus Marsarchaeota G2 archaeon OSP_D]PSN96829.1 MAG: threonine ammonia-lyase [Candidatus Marsarchaeota G2 archaeon ECH_B_2]PSO01398.1 MAG: threonine ammonia-lyase [Candidatus Marsarchaeota G2 archaeon ECH_B_3]PSO03530.1 MAG: threonine ammonia-lyase [Candidatus Marsarchaeota G2 archaeon ECH_B_1]PSO07566.1 MAG: threonine ammonia-lyase [Candidatus Marsarchaeota G2 archaeon BE_D]
MTQHNHPIKANFDLTYNLLFTANINAIIIFENMVQEVIEPTFQDIVEAQGRINDFVKKTPLEHSSSFSRLVGGDIWLKDENLQKTGSFKIRGALNRIRAASIDELSAGVVTASAGNHAQGVALASSLNGLKAKVFMPTSTPPIKVEATRSYGGETILVGESFEEAYNAAIKHAENMGSLFVHPFKDKYVIAGQGTVGLEIYQELQEPDYVIVPIGGGGLISGIAISLKKLNPKVKIIGVQASGAAPIFLSFKSGRPTEISTVETFAEGIATKKADKEMLDIIEKYVDDIVTVTDDEIAHAIVLLLERAKLVTEGAGAASLAAVLANKVNVKNKKTVCILSGGNIDLLTLDRVLDRGLKTAGRRLKIRVVLKDKPGQLRNLLDIIAKKGGNILSIDHDRTNTNISLGLADVTLNIETLNYAQQEEIIKAVENQGIPLQKL